MPEYPLRIIIDTNLWISFLITKDLRKLDRILFQSDIILLFSKELLEEFLDVVRRPKMSRYFGSSDVQQLLYVLEEYTEFIDVTSSVSLCRDEKDNFLLALAKDGEAHFLITGDKDLLELREFEATQIVTITSFLALPE